MTKINFGLLNGLNLLGANSLAKTTTTGRFLREKLRVMNVKNFISFETDIDFGIYGYTGEFFERCEERGVELDEENLSTMAFFYAIVKNEINDTQFNDYQITAFEKKIADTNFDNMYYLIAKAIICDDVSYIEKATQCDISLVDLYFACSVIIDTIDDEKEHTITKTLLNKYEYMVDTLDVLRNDIDIFQRLVYFVCDNKLKDRSMKIWSMYVKGTTKPMDADSDIERFKSMGFSNSNIAALNYYLKRGYAGSLVWQRALVSLLTLLANKEDDFNDVDENVLENIFSHVKSFDKKMESGNVVSLSTAISYYGIFNEIVNNNNFETIHRMALMEGVYNCDQIIIDFEKTNYDVRLDAIKSIIGENSFYEWFTSNIKARLSYVNDKTLFVSNLEKYLQTSVVELFTNTSPFKYKTYEADIVFKFFVNNDIVDIMANIDVLRPSLVFAYLKDYCDSKVKFDCLKYFYDKKEYNNALKLFNDGLYNDKYSKNIVPNGLTNDEIKAFVNMLCESAAYKSSNDFRYAFLNLLICDKGSLDNAFGAENAHLLYLNGLELARTVNSHSYHFNKDIIISNLESIWMSDEEKAARKAAIEAKKEAERLEKVKKENETARNEIAKLVSNYETSNEDKVKTAYGLYYFVRNYLSYNSRCTAEYREWKLKTLRDATMLINDLSDYMEIIGKFVEDNVITLDDAKNIIASITIVSAKAADKVA